MSNELYINSNAINEHIQKATEYGPPIQIDVKSLEKYGGPKGSLVYTVSDGVSILRLAGSF
jgi:hypothetical protein